MENIITYYYHTSRILQRVSVLKLYYLNSLLAFVSTSIMSRINIQHNILPSLSSSSRDEDVFGEWGVSIVYWSSGGSSILQ